MQLGAKAKERPVLVAKVGKERFVVAQITNILHSKRIDLFGIDYWLRLLLIGVGFVLSILIGGLLASVTVFGGLLVFAVFTIGRFIIIFFLVILLCSFLWGLSVPRGILKIILLPAPMLESALPFVPIFLEPSSRLQFIHTLCKLHLRFPSLQVLLTLILFIPHELDLVEAFLFRRK